MGGSSRNWVPATANVWTLFPKRRLNFACSGMLRRPCKASRYKL
jgi:hypothetical protein